ncbi:MAG TPA: glycosyltransferase family 9 protein [Azospirillum sp.]|nr:glycosyltransferase family 9 protein [Azospirillum sp.]
MTSSTTLIIQPLPGIGDMVWHSTHIRVLAAASPGGRVVLMSKRRSFADQLFAAESIIDDVLWLDRRPGRHDGVFGPFRIAEMLKGRGFQRAVILHKSWRYAFACLLAGIPERLGYGLGLQRPFLTRGPYLPSALGKELQIEQANRFVSALGLGDDLAPLLKAPPACEDGAVPSGERPWLALGVGGSGPEKKWAGDRFARLARDMAARGWQTILLAGGPKEAEVRPLVEAALAGTGVQVRDTFDLSVAEVMPQLARCGLFIGNDSGFLNIAAALRRPTVGLFGATKALTYVANLHPVVPVGGPAPFEGMERLTVEQVLATVDTLTQAGAISLEDGNQKCDTA